MLPGTALLLKAGSAPRDHPGEYIDSEGQPGTTHELSSLFVHDHDVRQRMIDLNKLERLLDVQSSWRRPHRLDPPHILAELRAPLCVDPTNPSRDGLGDRRSLPSHATTGCHYPYQLLKSWAFGNEIDFANRFLDDRLHFIGDNLGSWPPSAFSR